MDIVLELAGVTKIFRDFWGRPRVCALRDVDLTVRRGEICALVGRNGAGKSTLMQICLDLCRPTSGRVTVLGARPGDREVRQRTGYLPEESYLHGFLDARETLVMHAALAGLPGDVARRRAEHLLGMVGLEDARRRPVAEFSKGMLRRLCLAQALVGDPELLYLDEPTSGLDPIGTRQVKDLLLWLKRMGRTVLLSSHLLGEVEEVADRLVILDEGRVRLAGKSADLLAARRLEELFLEAIGRETR